MIHISGEVLFIESVKKNLDGTVELEGQRMSRKMAHMKIRLGVHAAREQREHELVSKGCADDVAEEMYNATVAPLVRQRDAITGQRHTETVPNDRDYVPGMLYPLNFQ